MGTIHHILSNYLLRLSVIMAGDTIDFYGYYIGPFVERLTLKPRKKAPDSCHGNISPFPKKGPNQKPKPKKTLDNPNWKGKLELSVDLGSDFFYPLPTKKKQNTVVLMRGQEDRRAGRAPLFLGHQL